VSDLSKLEAELVAADKAARRAVDCRMCSSLSGMSPGRREIVQRGLDSAIGAEKLAEILKKNGLDVPRRQIQTHRTERHS
jgi:hypothetical protein